ncbi:alpha/beta fold hydrolase [Dactylosporangium sp. NBC_01737]|nr:alpha/beta fold hydrolase [Dactylosporangium sp. NBC_01737]
MPAARRGAASYYRPMAAALAPAADVLAVQYPGRQDRRDEPCEADLGRLADRVAEALEGWTDRPLAFFGHSMGAVVGFEVVRRLEAAGAAPVRLFASGRRGPACRRDTPPVHLGDDAHVLAELRRLSGTDATLLGDDEVVRMILPAIRGDYTAIETYECPPGAAVAAPITVLTGDSDPQTTMAEAGAWRAHTTSGFDLAVFPGGHFFLNSCGPAVAGTVRAALGLGG